MEDYAWKTWAISWINRLNPCDIIFLQGPVGAGKTTFTQFCIHHLTGKNHFCGSPTYTLMNTYQYPHGTITHMDLYRLKNFEEFWAKGLAEPLGQSLCFIEWPERLAQNVQPQWVISITLTDDHRRWICQSFPS